MKKTIDSICNTVLRGKYKFVLISGNGGAGKITSLHIMTKAENLKRLTLLRPFPKPIITNL